MAQVPLVGRLDLPLYLPAEAIQYGAMLLDILDGYARDEPRYEVTGAFWGLRTCDGLSWHLFFAMGHMERYSRERYQLVMRAVRQLGEPPEMPSIRIEEDDSPRMQMIRETYGKPGSKRANRWIYGVPYDHDILPDGYLYRC